MQDKGLSEFKSFWGSLQIDVYKASITFLAHIDDAGEVELDLGRIAFSDETKFIHEMWEGEGATLSYFSLSGKAEDGTEFITNDLQFNSVQISWSEGTGSYMVPVGSCLRAEFRRKLLASDTQPIIRMRLKGFRNARQLRSECPLGIIAMDGESRIDDPDKITGYIALQVENTSIDLDGWYAQADALLEHIRRVMSFASATVLKGPVTEFYAGDDLKVIVLAQTRQESSPLRTFHYLNQQPVFDAAVTSFFSPPFEVKNLFFAIEWFAMEATYNEVRLINAMTALENLITSNLDDHHVLIRPENEFKKTKRALREVLRKCIGKWSADDAEEIEAIVKEFNEKLVDLNRRTIFQKLMTLAELWSVPLDGIGEDRIRAAKQARDIIVHRGHYRHDGNAENDSLWEHVMVVREIVVRFLLTAIGYRGSYFSYMGGYHEAQFPPQVSND